MDRERKTTKDPVKNGPDPEAVIRKQYHPALCNAMELELYYDREYLEFQQGVTLNTLPREIDFLVIRKKKEGKVKSELARFFRKCNIWEFKGYGGELNVQVYHKTMSYAYEYLASHGDLDGINDVTLSFLREGKPAGLMKWLEKEGYERVSSPGWVSRYKREGCPDLQIVNIAHPEAPAILRALSHKAEAEDIKRAAAYFEDMPEEELAKSRLVMQLSYRINQRRGGMNMELRHEDYVEAFQKLYVDPLKEKLEQAEAEIERAEAKTKQAEAKTKQAEAENEMLKAENARLRAQCAVQ